MRQSAKLCYGIAMEWRGKPVAGILAVTLVAWSSLSSVAWSQNKTPTPQPSSKEAKTVELESIQEHFESDEDPRAFPMNLFPKETDGTLLLTAAGVGLVSGLLILGGATIAAVNYEKQSRPDVLPAERLSAREAGRVGLGVGVVGLLSMFVPPLLVDLALPKYTPPVQDRDAPTPKDTVPKKMTPEATPQSPAPSTEPPAKKNP